MNKKIVINSKEDYNNFLKKIKYYKYYLFTNFDIDNNIELEELDIITKALNIKGRRKRISYVYDEAVKYINKYYSKDLCDFKDNQCFVQRESKSKNLYGCCHRCKYVKKDKGCPSSNISCKLIYCKPALKNLKKLKMKDINILKCLSAIQRFMLSFDFYSTREQVINDLYFGLPLWVLRCTAKGLRLTFYFK